MVLTSCRSFWPDGEDTKLEGPYAVTEGPERSYPLTARAISNCGCVLQCDT